jgi:hypothetical protein
MNAPRNTAYLMILFFLIFALGLTFYVITPFASKVYEVTNKAAPSELGDKVYATWLSLKLLVIESFYVLASIFIFTTFLSSVIERQTIMDYIIGTFGGLIITPIAIYIIATFWNTYVMSGVPVFTDISMTFVNNFTLIFVLNFIFGLLSFIFIVRGANQ